VYRRHGYVHIGRRKGYYPAGAAGREDAIVMRLDL
jgi:ribosomal-protein-alanine N-acetyltransferase